MAERGVEVGQRWIDNDPRERGQRIVTVESIDGGFVYVRSNKGRRSRIRIDRMNGNLNGYRRADNGEQRAMNRPATATASSAPWDGSSEPPPPWPSITDPRTPRCEHGWSARWGDEGERQHRCMFCRRWVWDHEWVNGDEEQR